MALSLFATHLHPTSISVEGFPLQTSGLIDGIYLSGLIPCRAWRCTYLTISASFSSLPGPLPCTSIELLFIKMGLVITSDSSQTSYGLDGYL